MAGATRRALSALTARGRCLLAAGGTLLLVGVLMGEQAFVQLAVFVLALPLLSAVAVARERFRLTVRRMVVPARLPRGDSAEVRLEVTNADTRTGGLWALTEPLPAELGRSPAFVVDRLPAGATATLRYRVHGGRRGRHVLGPVRLGLMDPFGLVERSAVGVDSAVLLVVPRVRPLGAGGPASGRGGGGEGARRSIAVHGEDDVSVRGYRYGDDLRKVHWRATARTGELMVRHEERPWQAQATLLLDTRSRAHLVGPLPSSRHTRPDAGGPAGDDCPPGDSLDWLVEAAASIGTTLARRGAALRAVTDAGELLPASGHGRLGPDDLLDRLAAVGPSRVSSLAAGVEQLCRAAAGGPVICLLGAVGPDDVADLVRHRAGPTTDLAVLVDVGSWADAGAIPGRRGLSVAARGALDRRREEATALLRAAGWRVAHARPDRSVADVWGDLGTPLTSPAGAAESLGAPA